NPSPKFEKELADFIAEKMRELGMEVQQIEVEPNRVSDLGRYRGDVGKPVLLCYGHLDTVPIGDPTKWKYPPFAAEIHDGSMWGRGTNDSKLMIAATLAGVMALKESGIELRGDIHLCAPADEEMGGQKGIHVMIERGMVKADYAVQGEYTTGPTKVGMVGHRGVLWFEVTTKGEAAHSRRRHEKVNAILKVLKVAQALDEMEFTGWKPHPTVPGVPYISPNIIRGGIKENVIADSCTLTCDIRHLPGQTYEMLMSDINGVLDRLRAADPKLEVEVKPILYGRPLEQSTDEPIIKYTQAAIKEVMGLEKLPPVVGSEAASDTRWFVYDAGIPMCSFSDTHTGHTPNEHIEIETYMNTIKLISLLSLMLLK
ncbi:MAG: M20 family metallopeptidase, partial [Candidatus Bathyarchaeia archaeon]